MMGLICLGNNFHYSDYFLSSPAHATYHSRPLTDNPCIPNPCNNGGTCLLGEEGNYACRCPATFAGATCEGKSYAKEIMLNLKNSVLKNIYIFTVKRSSIRFLQSPSLFV